MSKRKTTEQFIFEAKNVHGDKYDYSLINYINSRTKVDILCNNHGIFSQIPKNHIYNKQGCPSCFGNKKLTTNDFIEKVNKIHDNRYTYNNTVYNGNHSKVVITCNIHGDFEQTATRHLSGDGCPKCNGGVKYSQEDFIKKALEIHGDKYDYSLVEYKNSNTKVIIICKKHGEFNIRPANFLNGQDCRKCANENKKLTTKEFIKKAIDVHGDIYDYSLVKYERNNIKIDIICTKHGLFNQTPSTHLANRGCPKCSESKGEKEISRILNIKNILFIREKKFDDCIRKKQLLFDFYLPNNNLVIEFDGEQHYKPINHFGGEKVFEYMKKNDEIKENYLKSKNIDLIRISYKDLKNDNIENVLNGIL